MGEMRSENEIPKKVSRKTENDLGGVQVYETKIEKKE